VYNYGSINPDFAADMFRAFAKELFNDIILLRQSNFRPNVLNTIWVRKDVGEIFERLVKNTLKRRCQKIYRRKEADIAF